jgi:di- and tripeptidase
MASIFGARSSVRQQTRNNVETNSAIADTSSLPIDDDSTPEQNDSTGDGESLRTGENLPELLHRVQHDSSILAVAVSDQYIYAGTQEGEILAWSLDSYELALRIQAHKRAVLCLYLSQEGRLLFSSAGDAIVNAWCPRNLRRLYHIYSTYDVGDVFSVAYSTQFQTAYFGAQNTSIQWCSLKDSASRPIPSEERHPDRRNHRFFDSVAPGGRLTPRPASGGRSSTMSNAGEILEVDKAHMKHYAHFGYVYCMLLARGASRLVEIDEDMLISGGGDGTIKLWKLSGNPDDGIQELASLGEDDAESVHSLTVDGSFLYSGKLEGIIELWDLDTKQRLRVIKAQKGDVMTLQMGWGYLWSAGATGFARVISISGTDFLRILIPLPRNIQLCNTAYTGVPLTTLVRGINVPRGGRVMMAGYLLPLSPLIMTSNFTLLEETTIRSRSGISVIVTMRRMIQLNSRKICL